LQRFHWGFPHCGQPEEWGVNTDIVSEDTGSIEAVGSGSVIGLSLPQSFHKMLSLFQETFITKRIATLNHTD
jgi:hypothetical protein